MAATPTFTCLCGVQKKTSNHWILAICTSHDVRFLPWDWNLALDDNVIVLCGEGCAASLLSRSLGDWKQAEFLPAASAVRAATAPAASVAAPQPSFAAELRNQYYSPESVDRD
jgi:hypothetical protein